MRKVTGLTLLPILVLFLSANLTGCSALERVTESHAEADEAFYDAVAEEYEDMAHNAYRKKDDGTYEKWFTETQADRRSRTVESWKGHVEATVAEAKGEVLEEEPADEPAEAPEDDPPAEGEDESTEEEPAEDPVDEPDPEEEPVDSTDE